MSGNEEPIIEDYVVRARFNGVPIEKFIGAEAREQYATVSGKPDFIMVSYVRLSKESVKEIDTFILREDKDGTGMILMSDGDKYEKAKAFIEAMGGEVIRQ